MSKEILEFKIEKEVTQDRKINLDVKSTSDSAIDGERRKSMFRVDIRFKDSPWASFTIIPSPTANCQIYSIGCSSVIFNSIFSKDEKLFILKECQKIVGKNQLLLDIEQDYENRVDEIFKNSINVKSKYINTKYGTKMIIYLLNTDILNK